MLLYDIYASVPKIVNKKVKLNTNQFLTNFNASKTFPYIYSIQIFRGVNSSLGKNSGVYSNEGNADQKMFFISFLLEDTKRRHQGDIMCVFDQSDIVVQLA
jgi:hypothetical protein